MYIDFVVNLSQTCGILVFVKFYLKFSIRVFENLFGQDILVTLMHCSNAAIHQ